MKRDYKSETNWPSVYEELFPNLILKAKKSQPCPFCGGDDRFHLGDNWQQDGGHFCRKCGGGDGLTLIQKAKSCSFAEALKFCGVCFKSNYEKEIKTGINDYLSKLSYATNEHHYLISRGIKMIEPALIAGERLVIRKSNFDKVIGYESITANGTKLHQGLSGGWYQVQQGNGFVFVEGYADGISVARHRHPDKTIIVCFGISNIPNIVKQFREKYPTDTFFLCVDAGYKHDYSKKLRELQGCLIDAPDTGDWNDFYDRPVNLLEQGEKLLLSTGKHIATHKETRYSIVLELTDKDTGDVYHCFFDAKRTGKKRFNYSVKPKSKFAQLYQKSTGKKPKRWNQSEQLVGHLIDLEFYCTTKKQRSQSGTEYMKVDKIRPKKAFKLPVLDNDTLKSNRRQTEDKLKTQETSTPPINSVTTTTFRTPISYTEKTIPIVDQDITITPSSINQYQTPNNLGGFDFMQVPNESVDQYFERVIEQTWK